MITLLRLFLLAALLLPSSAYSAVFFSDNFDSCTTGCYAEEVGVPPNSPSTGSWAQWYGVSSDTYDGTTHYVGEITSPGRGGTGKSFKMWRHNVDWWAGNGAYLGALVPSQWAPQRHVFMRFWMKIPPAFDCFNAYNMKFFRIITDGTPDVAYIQINGSAGWTRDSGEFQISDNFIHPWQEPWGWPWETLLTNSEVKTKMWDGTWHSHEFEFDLDGDTLRYWVDDVLQYENTNWVWNLSGGITWINHFNLGNQLTGAYWQNSWQAMEMDDLVFSTTPIGSGGGGGGDPAPYVASIPAPQPARSSTGVSIANREIHFHIHDDTDVLTANGVVNIDGTNHTCSAELTCIGGGTADLAVTYTKGSDWGYEQTVNVQVSGFRDTAGGTMSTDSWSYTTAAEIPGAFAITTTTLDNGTVGTPYNQQLASENGTTPVTWSIGSTPYDPGYPYPPSTNITGLSFDWANIVQSGPGSDLWLITWAGDNNVYMAWGDGGGHNGGTNLVCRTSCGLERIDGTPPDFTFTPIWGCKADGNGCDEAATHNASCDAPYGNNWTEYGVPNVLFSVDNTLYLVQTKRELDKKRLWSSTNFGQSWTSAGWEFTTNTGDFTLSGVAVFGMGNSGARDNYIYMYGGEKGDIKNVYLARVPKTEVMTQGSWEYFTGTYSSPTWGTWANATSIHYDANRQGDYNTNYVYVPTKVQYFAALDRYVLTTYDGLIHKPRVYDAPEPWGPWTTVYYNDTWGGYPAVHGHYWNVIPKFTSADGKEFWFTYSGSGTPYNYDYYFLLKGTFTTATPDTLPAGLTLSSSGAITGTPTAQGTTNFTVNATDSASPPNSDSQALAITVNPASLGTITITATSFEDTYIQNINGRDDTNFSTDEYLQVYQLDFNPVLRVLIMDNTDIAALSDNILITSATLHLYQTHYDLGGGTDPMRIYRYRISDNVPIISTVTWNAFTGTTTGGSTPTEASLVSGWKTWDITEMTAWAHANDSPLYILLDGAQDGTTNTNRVFASRNHTTGEASAGGLRPYITIKYTQLTGEGVPISAPGKMRVSKMKGSFR